MVAATPDRNDERKATSEAPGVHLPQLPNALDGAVQRHVTVP
ncbi:hypothetical protein [Rhodococcus opacus]|uniref:Uncharacterized protein n=1 Tax=Rhodococcus opacus TaxID=37919 RepID=A0AAX3YUL1_RHOOP|nr:hypothetical protein [Rhodococcus opacus]MCZ4585947.1 hypothetical protein [Rhodococcus opacus]WLF52096.1 hypothetical protein Q5707_42460 [Rhodococcus opacus]